MSSNVNVYDAPPLRRAGVLEATTTSGGSNTHTHGLITWGIATLLTIYLLTSAIGGIIGGGFSALGGIASAAGTGVKEAAKPIAQAAGISPEMLQQQAQAYLPPTNPDPAKMSPHDAQKDIASNLAT